MSTQSLIAKQNYDGTYRAIYCHMDGYLTYNGAMLLDHYNTPEMVNKLLDLGDLSFLAPKLDPDPAKPHSFDYDKRQEGVTVAYGRDRGEKHTESINDMSLEKLLENAQRIDYIYIFTKDNTWMYLSSRDQDGTMRNVEDDINKIYKQYGILQRPKDYYGFLNEDIANELNADINQTSAEDISDLKFINQD